MPERSLLLLHLVVPLTRSECQKGGKGLIRLPAVTPRTPAPNITDFQQFCDGLRTDLPGDSFGRGSFDTSTRFVAGDWGGQIRCDCTLGV